MALILVIEDNAVNLELMTYLLQAHGHRTLSASDGLAGLVLARRQPPDLVICDLQMPGLDGHGVAAALRNDPVLHAVPRIAVTAAAMVGDREQALASGFQAHVPKPIDPQAFVPLVESFLALRAGNAPQADPGESLGGSLLPDDLRAPHDGLLLLMVDDQPRQLEYKRDLLEPAGYTVLTADSAEAAWPVLCDAPVDLVLSDVMMPGMGGFALLRRVRAEPRLHGLPFLFLTSTACDSVSQQQGLALGANAYLMRPIEPLALLDEIRAALSAPRQG
ncbi:MAG: response regulator [Rubrivivax sp.]|nr:response regulator [Rubrivivax sp.]